MEEENKFFSYFTQDVINLIHIILITLALIHIIYFIIMLIKINCFDKKNSENQNLRKINDECCICLNSIENEVQLLCSHSYCGKCLIEYSKQHYDFSKIHCAICREESKLVIVQFDKNENNKEIYDEVISYNHQITGYYKTSLCFCVDMFRLFYYYMKQLLDLRNPRYAKHRVFLLLLVVASLAYILYPIQPSAGDLIEDIIFFILCVIVIAEKFYRMIRRQTNEEFDRMNSDSINNIEINARENNLGINNL